jgi:uncharacterized protein (TIGR00255 family)
MSGVQSMTGFASVTRQAGTLAITCDIRSVNNKGLDTRLRVPAGLEVLETQIKKLVAGKVVRGSLQVFINIAGAPDASLLQIDETLFTSLAGMATRLAAASGIAPPTADGILAVRGIVTGDDADKRVDPETIGAEAIMAIQDALESLVEVRRQEGDALRLVLTAHVDQIEELAKRAHADPASQPEAVRDRLKAQIDALLQDPAGIDPARMNSEAALLATKADIREEVDRLEAHVSAARKLLEDGGAIGRKLDFLSQEFNREANTICSKASSSGLTAIGLELKAVIDQFREQVQNLQ